MNFRKISANTIYPITSSPIENGVIIIDETGKIIAIDKLENQDKNEIEFFDGVIVPGFINAHCHLELSHLNGVAQTGTGLIDFISQVIKNRNHSQEIIQEAIIREEKNMIASGIVAVGDISNTTDTFAQKQKGILNYYTFVEYFDLFQEANTENIVQQYDAVFNQLFETDKNKKSKVPHANYSVSRKLFEILSRHCERSEAISDKDCFVPRNDASENVIANEANQSLQKTDCFVPRNDASENVIASEVKQSQDLTDCFVPGNDASENVIANEVKQILQKTDCFVPRNDASENVIASEVKQSQDLTDCFVPGNDTSENFIASEVKQSLQKTDCFVPSNNLKTISIHNQETPPENELFLTKTGDFIDFYAKIGCKTDAIPTIEKTAIHYALEYLQKENRNLFVHNTLTTKQDIEAAQQKLGNENTFWVTCPNANLYIENNLPNYRNFLETNATVCIGTDSLTSNWQLNILEEMKTILKFQSYLDFETVLNWATINGAKALGFDAEFGSIEIGKMPGLVLIENMENGKLTDKSTSRKII